MLGADLLSRDWKNITSSARNGSERKIVLVGIAKNVDFSANIDSKRICWKNQGILSVQRSSEILVTKFYLIFRPLIG